MAEAFPIIFQWFVLLSTICLAGFILRALIFSFTPKPGGAAESAGAADAGGDVKNAGVDSGPPFFTARRPVLWQIIIIAAFSRIMLYGVAYLSARFIRNNGGGFFATLPDLWQRSDASHYMAIARDWYVNAGEDRVFLVFLPFFPLLTKILAPVFGGAVPAGIAISLLSYIAACVLIYEIALLIGQDENAAFAAVKYAVFFPASFFVNGAFSEGLFLLLSALCFHFMLRKKWIASACFGMLAAFTRYYGLLLAIPYAIECAQDICGEYFACRPPAAKRPGTKRRGKKSGRAAPAPSAVLRRVAPLLLIPAGTGLFLIVNYAVSGNFFQFLIYQKEHWNQNFTFFFNNMRTLAANTIKYDRATSASLFIPELVCVVLFIGLMAYGVASRFRVSMMAYLGVYFLLSISASWMLSFPRYIFGAAPVFPLLASAGSRHRAADAIVSLVCIGGLIFLTIAYACGYHVY